MKTSYNFSLQSCNIPMISYYDSNDKGLSSDSILARFTVSRIDSDAIFNLFLIMLNMENHCSFPCIITSPVIIYYGANPAGRSKMLVLVVVFHKTPSFSTAL